MQHTIRESYDAGQVIVDADPTTLSPFAETDVPRIAVGIAERAGDQAVALLTLTEIDDLITALQAVRTEKAAATEGGPR